MDLFGVEKVITHFTRHDLAQWEPTDRFLAGGTFLFSEPNYTIRRLYDLPSLEWPDVIITEAGLTIAATCTIDSLIHTTYPPEWIATPLFTDCAHALLASWKIWHAATIGGNIANAFAAGAFTGMATLLQAQALIWTCDGHERISPVASLIADNGRNTLAPGELIRSIFINYQDLCSHTILFKHAMAPYGRSGVVVMGAYRERYVRICITAATRQPQILAFPINDPPDITACIDNLDPDQFYTDAHGSADWRKAMTVLLCQDTLLWAHGLSNSCSS